jgi:hypothetical protein
LQLTRFSYSNVDVSSPLAHIYFGFLLCRSFIYKDDAKPPRAYPSILGYLVRKHFPGFVPMPSGGESIAWTWKHYSYASDPEGILDNAQKRVLHDFWVNFFDFSSFKNSEVDSIYTNGFVPFYLCASL